VNVNIVERLLGAPGKSVAYVDGAGQMTYADLGRAVRAYASRLADTGFRPGSRALVVSDDSVPAVVAILAVWWNGGIPVPVSPMLTVQEIEFVAKDCYAAFLHLDESAAAKVPMTGPFDVPRGGADWALPSDTGNPGAAGNAPPLVAQESGDVVLIQYTSGSTGTPKGVLHTRAGIDSVLGGFGKLLGLGPTDVVLSTAKLSFGYGFGNSLLFPLAAGARAVLMSGPPDVYKVAAAVAAHQPTVLCSVPRMYAALLDERKPLGSLRLAVSAGEHLPSPICEWFVKRYGVPIINGLGATEVLHIVVATRGTQPGWTGTAVPGIRISVRDDEGNPVTNGSPGRLHIAGASVAAGYLDRPEATTRTFADGGAYTGDIVRRGPGGVVEFVCRRDDLINVGGYKVSPFEIEAAMLGVPSVAQCAVVGSRDDRGLEQAVAYLVPTPGAELDAVHAAARRAFRALPAFKRPAVVEVVDRLPVTSTGKLARFKLRAAGVREVASVTMRVLRNDPGRTLVCIPYAGGSSGSFTRLARHLPGWRVVAGEASYRNGVTLGEAAEAWWKAITPYVSDGSVLLGHSVGAVLAAEVAGLAGGRLDDAHVVLSALPVWAGRIPREFLALDDETLVVELLRAGLLPRTSLTPDEVRRLVLPRFRRDLALVAQGWEGSLGTAVHVLAGTHDPLCTLDAITANLPADLVSTAHAVDGDHYFVATNAARTAEVLRTIFRH
jgi:acyl-coenzyme A synthetase/AMP-(fatty) acid ligase/surfactin synthase thioesterase subunit